MINEQSYQQDGGCLDDQLNLNLEMGDGQQGGHFLRVRGLPWTATKSDIIQFFEGCNICSGEDGIQMTVGRGGRPSGECYVEFMSEDDMNNGFKKHRQNMGHRYVEIFKSERSEMEWVCRKSEGGECNGSGFAWLRGIPFGCSKEEIAQFFQGLKIVPNGISLPVDETGRSTGEAYVQFASKEIAETAMGKHKEKIGHRYIEIFRSSQQEVKNALFKSSGGRRGGGGGGGGRPGPYNRNDRFGDDSQGGGRFGGGMNRQRNMNSFYDDGYNDCDNYNDGGFGSGYGSSSGGGKFGRQARGGGGGGGFGRGGGGNRRGGGNFGGMRDQDQGPSMPHMVHMRGIPFKATEREIAEFFKPVPLANINIKFGQDGRAAGSADVGFYSHQDAIDAMKKDKQNLGHRYVELFFESTQESETENGNGGRAGQGNGSFDGFQGWRSMQNTYQEDNGNDYGGNDDYCNDGFNVGQDDGSYNNFNNGSFSGSQRRQNTMGANNSGGRGGGGTGRGNFNRGGGFQNMNQGYTEF